MGKQDKHHRRSSLDFEKELTVGHTIPRRHESYAYANDGARGELTITDERQLKSKYKFVIDKVGK